MLWAAILIWFHVLSSGLRRPAWFSGRNSAFCLFFLRCEILMHYAPPQTHPSHTRFPLSQSNVSVHSQPGLCKSRMILCYRLTSKKKPRPEQARPGMPSSKALLLSSVPNPCLTSRASLPYEAAAFSPKNRRKPWVLKEYPPPSSNLPVSFVECHDKVIFPPPRW